MARTKTIDLSLKNVLKTKLVNKPLYMFRPKYNNLEVLFSDDKTGYMYIIPGIVKYDDLIREFGDYIVLSIHNYEDTKTTSVILKDKRINYGRK